MRIQQLSSSLSLSVSVVVAVAVLGAGGPALCQSTHPTDIQFEIGYQWLDVSGNEDVYRTQVDEDDGFVIRDFSLFSIRPPGTPGAYDRLRIDAAGYDGSPDGNFRFEMSRDRTYSLRLTHQRHQFFSSLPTWANPLFGGGSLVSQHTMDRKSDAFDVELELFPHRRITPILGYRRFDYDGPGTTTRTVGGDEFLLRQDLDQSEQEYRLGLAFDVGPVFRGTVTQGWRDFEGTQRFALGESGDGNGSRPVLGRQVRLDFYDRTEEVTLDGSITSVFLTSQPARRIRLFGTYVHSDYDGDVTDDESLSGDLVSFDILRFFEGQNEAVRGTSNSPAWNGEGRIEIDLSRRFSLSARYGASDYSVDGSALITTLFLDPSTFGGASVDDVLQMVEAENSYDRREDQVELVLNARSLGPFRLWAGYRSSSQDIDVSQGLAEIVVPGGQSGSFERDIDTYRLGAGLKFDRVELSLENVSEDADNAVVRTDFLDRDRWRGRLDLKIVKQVRLQGIWEDVEAENETPGIDYRGEIEHMGATLQIEPLENLSFDFGYDSYTNDTLVTIRRPEDFDLEPSIYSEDGQVLDGGVYFHRERFELRARYSHFENEGVVPLELDRTWVYLGFDIAGPYGIGAELQDWDYKEIDFPIAGYSATRYGLYLRYNR